MAAYVAASIADTRKKPVVFVSGNEEALDTVAKITNGMMNRKLQAEGVHCGRVAEGAHFNQDENLAKLDVLKTCRIGDATMIFSAEIAKENEQKKILQSLEYVAVSLSCLDCLDHMKNHVVIVLQAQTLSPLTFASLLPHADQIVMMCSTVKSEGVSALADLIERKVKVEELHEGEVAKEEPVEEKKIVEEKKSVETAQPAVEASPKPKRERKPRERKEKKGNEKAAAEKAAAEKAAVEKAAAEKAAAEKAAAEKAAAEKAAAEKAAAEKAAAEKAAVEKAAAEKAAAEKAAAEKAAAEKAAAEKAAAEKAAAEKAAAEKAAVEKAAAEKAAAEKAAAEKAAAEKAAAEKAAAEKAAAEKAAAEKAAAEKAAAEKAAAEKAAAEKAAAEKAAAEKAAAEKTAAEKPSTEATTTPANEETIDQALQSEVGTNSTAFDLPEHATEIKPMAVPDVPETVTIHQNTEDVNPIVLESEDKQGEKQEVPISAPQEETPTQPAPTTETQPTPAPEPKPKRSFWRCCCSRSKEEEPVNSTMAPLLGAENN